MDSSSQELQTQEQPSSEQSSQDNTQSSEQLNNTVGAALDRFDNELKRGSTAAVASSQQQRQPKPRVFDGLDEQEAEYFRSMSNQAYAALYPQFLAAKKLKAEHDQLSKDLEQQRNLHFFEHEGAYRLIPEYSDLQQNGDQITAEIQHWQEQLALIEEGKPFRPLVRNAKGEIVYGEEREPTPANKVAVLNALSQGHIYANNIREKLSQFESTFKQQHGSYLQQLQETRTRIFKGADLEKLSKAAATKLDMFPPAVRGKPEVKMLAEGMVIIEGLIKLVDDLKAGQVSAVQRARTSVNNGPKNAAAGAAVGGGKTVGDALQDFKKAGF